MARTTSSAVISVLLSDYDGESSLTSFLEAATALTSRIATCASTRGVPLSATELELIERWLTAHFYAISDKPYTSKHTADSGASYAGQTSTGLNATLYGQTAITLDWSGCLAAIAANPRQTAVGFWLGKPPSTQINAEDRR